MSFVTKNITRDPLTFAIGKVFHCRVGDLFWDVFDSGDCRRYCPARETTLDFVQRNRVFNVCRWSENRFCCLIGQVDNKIRGHRVKPAAGD